MEVVYKVTISDRFEPESDTFYFKNWPSKLNVIGALHHHREIADLTYNSMYDDFISAIKNFDWPESIGSMAEIGRTINDKYLRIAKCPVIENET